MIYLDQLDIDAILKLDDLPDQIRDQFVNARQDGLTIDEEMASELLEFITDHLMIHGFNSSYEPTPEGVVLERLVDRLSENLS